MKPLSLELNNCVAENSLADLKPRVYDIHKRLLNKDVAEKDWLGWLDLPNNSDSKEIAIMESVISLWKRLKVEVVVVIGIGGSYLGAKAGYDFIYGPNSIVKPQMELLFAGNSISSEALIAALKYVENKTFAINVVSKSGTTLEPSIAFREFRTLLEAKFGVAAARDLIVATTDRQKGVLFDLANKKGYKKLIIPDNVGGRFSVLSPVGLFPFMCAGMDIKKILEGAQSANADANNTDFYQNDCYRYAMARYVLSSTYSVEMMASYEPRLQYFAEWWKQLFAESEGKNAKGLFPVSSTFSTDLHSLGQMIQDGPKILFETVLFLDKPKNDLVLKTQGADLDKLKYLDGKSIHQVNYAAFKATLDAHKNTANVPCMVLKINTMDEYTLGYLFQFFERALAISAYLLGVNPFNQPGVEVYKSNMYKNLKSDK